MTTEEFTKMKRFRPFIIALLLLLGIGLIQSPSTVVGQESDYLSEATALLATMTPAERVGQLFLVAFEGAEVDLGSEIADLILNYRVGGVVLLAKNDNVGSLDNSAVQIAELSNSLQELSLLGTPAELVPEEIAELFEEGGVPIPTRLPDSASLPLFIATVHEGDGPPFTELRNGLSALPNPMALGATWQPAYGEKVGEITGSELSAVGINMLLGPSLDVLEDPRPLSSSDLGTRSFGGDPYWVGLMGRSYITGVHRGSNDRIAVIAKHFPGYGSSDRPINEEVGTVRKSLEQLKQIELAPFFAVTDELNEPPSTADGLLTTHVRYQGFQGNIRAATAPVSFDPQALKTLMQLPEFAPWRQAGGVIVSDALGVRAVQRFYDDTEQEFPHRQVAKDALLAGNDILYLSDFALGDAEFTTQVENIRDTINWFQEKYRTDQTFQQRIDEAVLRILQLKLRLYDGDFAMEQVAVDSEGIASNQGLGQDAVFDMAQDAVTLIYPSPSELAQQLPPTLADDIVIFTDVREAQQCSGCPAQPWLGVDALEQRMLALYGPQASEQVRPGQFRSFSFDDLKEFLIAGPVPIPTPTSPAEPPPTESAPPGPSGQRTATPTPTVSPAFLVQRALPDADWVIFAMLQPDTEVAASDTLSLFLAQRPDIARNAKVIVFAYNAPYYLDTTEISKLTGYFGIYSKTDAFVDASVRALFQESPLRGRSPVNIEGIGYNLFDVTRPDPNQVIELFIVDNGTLKSPPSQEPLEVVPGVTLRLQTGVLIDGNGNPVPDGTLVQFVQQDRIQGFVNVIDERPTSGGVANLDYLLEARSGNFRITALSGDARASQEVDIVIGENAVVSVNTPTPAPTFTPTASATPTATATASPSPSHTPTMIPTPTATVQPFDSGSEPTTPIFLSEAQMLLAFGIGLLATGSAGFVIGRNEQQDLREITRYVLWGLLGSLIAYNYFALGLPGTDWLDNLGSWAGLLTTAVGGTIGLTVYRVFPRNWA